MTRTLKTFAAFIVAMSLLAACGGGDDADSDTTDAPSSTDETTATTAAPEASGDDAPSDDTGDAGSGNLDEALEQVPFETRMGIVTDQLSNIDRFEADGTHVDIYYSAFDETSPPEMDCMIIGMSVLLEGETATLHFPDRDPHTCD